MSEPLPGRVRVVIVGGGVAGLTAAWRLQTSGFTNFVLIELESTPGGTSRSGSNRLISFPWGAHYIPAPMKENVQLVLLLSEMGVVEGREPDGSPVIAEHVLCNQINRMIVNFIQSQGCEAMGLHSLSSVVLFAEKAYLKSEDGRRIDLGLVGEVKSVNARLLRRPAFVHCSCAPLARRAG